VPCEVVHFHRKAASLCKVHAHAHAWSGEHQLL
jgi:hypothetical protein